MLRLCRPVWFLLLLCGSAPADVPAVFNQVWVQHNVVQDDRNGMLVHCNFTTYGVKDVPCRAVAFFVLRDGRALQDQNGQFNTSDGGVSASTKFTPAYVTSTYKDLKIFMPYSELDLVPGRWDLKFRVGIYSNAFQKYLTYSKYVNFTYTKS